MFMKPQISHEKWYEIEANTGTWYIPYDIVGDIEDISELAEYIEGKPQSTQIITGYGARLSAPGYMDCTEWSVFQTKEEAKKYLIETYSDDDESNEFTDVVEAL